jgi:hypothetical protein
MEQPEALTFAEAISAGKEVFQAAKQALHTLPSASEGPCKGSSGDGPLQVQEDGLLTNTGLKAPKSKQKSSSAPSETTHPGYKIGVAAYTSPFWALVEVRRRPFPCGSTCR